mmetsp:Transcript_4771/g.7202  ORF Transcript_4771/g.7202 Transcript_4771/m.7202 type:complete len:193 (-) Transcript_4771:33-611(-)
MLDKANLGIGQALYSYGKDLFQAIREEMNSEFRQVTQNQLNQKFETAHRYLEEAVKRGVHSANFLLGMMYLEGILVTQDIERGIEHLISGAAYNNAYCYYYLSMLYHEGEHVPKNPRLEFLYLKRSAEEGFVQMQHNLGINYYKGDLTRKNDRLALAWLRESCRNGYMPSYYLAGEILYHGNPGGLPEDRAV